MKTYHVHSKSWPNMRPITTYNVNSKPSKKKYLLWGVTAVLSAVSVGLLGGMIHQVNEIVPQIKTLKNVLPDIDAIPEIMESLTNVNKIVPEIQESVETLQEIHEILTNLCETETFKNVCNI